MSVAELVREILPAYRRAHLTPAEWRETQRTLRRRLELTGTRDERIRRLPDVLGPAELARLLEAAYTRSGGTGVMFRVLFESGVRVSELTGLEVADVDWPARTLKVRSGKGRKDRLVLITPSTLEQLRVMLEGRTRGALFESRYHGRYSVRRIQQLVSQCAGAAGIDKAVHPHTLRHSMATLLRNEGAPLDVIQLLLGHDDPRTTQRYVRMGLQPVRDAYDRAMGAGR